MTNNTIFCGLALIALGITGYINGAPDPVTKELPKTALIPAYFGGVLLLAAVIVILKESLRKHVMHVAALAGLIGVVGGFMPVYRQTMVKNLPFDASAPAVRSGIIMSVICLIFVVLCVKSFIDARRSRAAA